MLNDVHKVFAPLDLLVKRSSSTIPVVVSNAPQLCSFQIDPPFVNVDDLYQVWMLAQPTIHPLLNLRRSHMFFERSRDLEEHIRAAVDLAQAGEARPNLDGRVFGLLDNSCTVPSFSDFLPFMMRSKAIRFTGGRRLWGQRVSLVAV